ncbi:hypothetical protein KM043_000606 [Ampulex compressa]|nr:hypothetical protein KM043_000606 [Ampulex compressa]
MATKWEGSNENEASFKAPKPPTNFPPRSPSIPANRKSSFVYSRTAFRRGDYTESGKLTRRPCIGARTSARTRCFPVSCQGEAWIGRVRARVASKRGKIGGETSGKKAEGRSYVAMIREWAYEIFLKIEKAMHEWQKVEDRAVERAKKGNSWKLALTLEVFEARLESYAINAAYSSMLGEKRSAGR